MHVGITCIEVFGMNLWESVKELQLFCHRLDYVRIVHSRILKFWFGLKLCDNIGLYIGVLSGCVCYNATFLKCVMSTTLSLVVIIV